MKELKPNDKRAKNAILLIWILLGLGIISIISSFLQLNLLQNAAEGNEINDTEANINDIREQIIAILYIITFIISGITFIQWFRRAYFNLHLLNNRSTYKEGWAAGSWFVPILNLFRPYQIMQELYHETRLILLRNKVKFNSTFSSKYLGWWWALWVFSGISGQSIQSYSNTAESIDQLIWLTFASLVSNIMGIFLAIITIKVIKDYAEIEPLLVRIQKKRIEEASRP